MKVTEGNVSSIKKELFGFFSKPCSALNKKLDESIFSDKTILYGGGIVASGLTLAFLPSFTKTFQYLKLANLLLLGFFTYKLHKNLSDKKKENIPKENISQKDKTKISPKKKLSDNPTILVVDNFTTPSSACGNQLHGDIVTNLIKAALPNAKIVKKEISETTFKEIVEEMKNNKKYDAINFSNVHNFKKKLEDLKIRDENGELVQITPDNIDKYKLEIKNFLLNEGMKEFSDLKNTIKDLQYITDNGTLIFQSINNNINKEVSISDFWDFDEKYSNNNNPNLITVSANDSEERYLKISDIKEKSIFPLTKMSSGIDYTGDKIPDITDTKSIQELSKFNNFSGNSFGTAIALIKHFKK